MPDTLFAWLVVMFGTGAALYYALPFEPDFPWITIALLLGSATLLLARQRAVLFYAGALALSFSCGFALAQWRTVQSTTPLVATQTIEWVRGIVAARENIGTTTMLELEQVQVWRWEKGQVPARIRISIHGTPDVGLGDDIAVRISLRPLPLPPRPGGADRAIGLHVQDIGAVGNAIGRVRVLHKAGTQQADSAGQLRARIGARLDAVLQDTSRGSRDRAAIAKALLTGERSSLSSQVNLDMRNSGLYHILSISGLHMAIVCGVVFVLLRALLAAIPHVALHWPVKKIASVLALISGFAYLWLAGYPVPASRSYIMAALLFAAVLVDRSVLSTRSVALAALLLLLLAPHTVLDPSFQLSFAAVLALVAFYEHQAAQAKKHGAAAKAWRYAKGLLATSLVAGFATAPFVAQYFGMVSLYGVLANALAVPLSSFVVMPLGFIALLVMPLHLEALPLWLMGQGIDALMLVAKKVSGLAYAAPAVSPPGMAALTAYVAGGLWLCLMKGKKRWWGLLGPLLLLVLWQAPPQLVVDDGGRVISLQLENGSVAYVGITRKSSTTNQMDVMMGLSKNASRHWLGNAASFDKGGLHCQEGICRMAYGAVIFALLLPEKLEEGTCPNELKGADVIIAPQLQEMPCPDEAYTNKHVIFVGKATIKEKGTHLFWVTRNGVKLSTSGDGVQERLWSARR